MAHINLLPWRQELRKQRQQEFIAILAAVALVTIGILLFAHVVLSTLVSDQEGRNRFIKGEIDRLDVQIKEIDEIQKRRDELLGRMKVIQDLQWHRPVIVHIFDEMVHVMPDGVYLTTLERSGDTFKMTGIAESANQISNLMRNLDASPWFKNPMLSNVVADQPTANSKRPKREANNPGQYGNKFALTVQLKVPEVMSSADNKGKPGQPPDSAKGGAKK
jgi:type IV pilus assembly protein PilN